jgi:excinuclease ABC subunit B
MGQTTVADSKRIVKDYYTSEEKTLAADPVISYMSKPELEKMVLKTQKQMEKAAKDLDFIEAARLRDEYFELKKLLEAKK